MRAVFKKYDLPFDERDIINKPECYQEMVEKTGQTKQPCVEIGGRVLADVSGDEVEAWMLQNGVVTPTGRRRGRRAYTFQDLIALRAARDLLAKKVRLKDVARNHSGSRIVSCLEGGYNLSALGRSVEAHLRVLADV